MCAAIVRLRLSIAPRSRVEGGQIVAQNGRLGRSRHRLIEHGNRLLAIANRRIQPIQAVVQRGQIIQNETHVSMLRPKLLLRHLQGFRGSNDRFLAVLRVAVGAGERMYSPRKKRGPSSASTRNVFTSLRSV